jgi:hypothetical protein
MTVLEIRRCFARRVVVATPSVIARSEATKQSMLQQAEEWIASLRSQ